MAHTEKNQAPAAVVIPDLEWLKVINQQAESLKRKNQMLARLKELAAKVEALQNQAPAGYIEPRRRAIFS